MNKNESSFDEILELENQLDNLNKRLKFSFNAFKSFRETNNKDKRKFLFFLLIGVYITINSLIFIVLYPEMKFNTFVLSTTFWNALLNVGIVISGLAFIIYQLYKSKKDTMRLYLTQKSVDESIKIYKKIKKVQKVYYLQLALGLSDIIKPKQLEKYSLMGSITLKHDQINPSAFIEFLQDKIKNTQSMKEDEKKRIEAAIKGFKILEKDIAMFNKNPTKESLRKAQLIAEEMNKQLIKSRKVNCY